MKRLRMSLVAFVFLVALIIPIGIGAEGVIASTAMHPPHIRCLIGSYCGD